MAGATGNISIAIARAFPSLNFVVQDLPHMVPHAETNIPADLKSRINVQAYDFFTPQPMSGADVYFYRNDFHNWSDTYALKMLDALKPALKKEARLLIIDIVLPQKGAVDAFDEKIVRTLDLVMLQSINARERELRDWTGLLERSGGWKYVDAKQPEGSKLWIMEWAWEGGSIANGTMAVGAGVNGIRQGEQNDMPEAESLKRKRSASVT